MAEGEDDNNLSLYHHLEMEKIPSLRLCKNSKMPRAKQIR